MMELAPLDYCTSINGGWLEDCIADCDMEMQIDWTFEIMQEQMLCDMCMEEDNCDEYFDFAEDHDDYYEDHDEGYGPFDCLINAMTDPGFVLPDSVYDDFYQGLIDDPTAFCEEEVIEKTYTRPPIESEEEIC